MVKKVVHRNFFCCFSFLKIGFLLWIFKDCKIVPRPVRCSLTCQDLYCKISSRLEVVCYFNYYWHSKYLLLYFTASLLRITIFMDVFKRVLNCFGIFFLHGKIVIDAMVWTDLSFNENRKRYDPFFICRQIGNFLNSRSSCYNFDFWGSF